MGYLSQTYGGPQLSHTYTITKETHKKESLTNEKESLAKIKKHCSQIKKKHLQTNRNTLNRDCLKQETTANVLNSQG